MSKETEYLSSFNLGQLSHVRGRIGWKGLKSKEYTESGPFLVAGTHIKGDKIQWDRCQHINHFRYDESPEIKLNLLDIIISKDGTIGRVALVNYLPGPTTINSTMMLVRLKNQESLCSEYIFYFLQGGKFKKLVSERVAGSGVPHLFQADMKTLTVYAPVIEKQRKIAKILSTLDNLIVNTQSLIDKYTAVKQGMVADLFSRGIDLSGTPGTNKNYGQLRPSVADAREVYQETDLGWVPKVWSVVTLGDISEKITSGSRDWASYYSDEGELFVRISNLTREHINFRWKSIKYVDIGSGSEGERTRLEGGDILISITADLGIIGVVPDDFERAYINQHTALVRINKNVNNPRYIGHALQSYSGQHQFEQLGDSGAKAGLNLPTIASLKCLLPSNIEQNEITNRLDVIDQLVADYKIEKEKYLNQKKGLMQDLLTGKVKV
jgi:type I restriction enzyme, S subunit